MKPSISTFKPPIATTTTNALIVGFCQTEFQPLDPKLLFKSGENQQFYRCSQSAQLTTYDSGFVDDQTVESLTTANHTEENLLNEQKDEQTNVDDILLTKSEDEEDRNETPDTDQTNPNQQKWKPISKRVSFQGLI